MPEDLLVFGFGLRDARDRLSGDDQHMHRRLWPDVPKGHHQVVFIDDRARDFARDDLLEQRLAHSAFARSLHQHGEFRQRGFGAQTFAQVVHDFALQRLATRAPAPRAGELLDAAAQPAKSQHARGLPQVPL